MGEFIIETTNSYSGNTMKKCFIFLFLLSLSLLTACTDTSNNSYVLVKNTENSQDPVQDEIQHTNNNHNLLNHTSVLLKTPELAIQVAEPVLFSVYGEKKILDQRPYRVYDTGTYYKIEGSLKEEYIGGTFEIIINKTNAEIIKITHGK